MKLNQETVLEKLEEIHGENVDLSKIVWVDKHTKLKISCKLCKKEREAIIGNLRKPWICSCVRRKEK